MKFFLFIESYTFLFQGSSSDLVYNSLDGTCFSYTSPIIRSLLQEIAFNESCYGTFIDDEVYQQHDVKSFVEELRSSFMGDLIVCDETFHIPFIPHPIFRVNELKFIQQEKDNLFNKNIIKNIQDLYLYLPTLHEYHQPYYKQYPHPYTWKGDSLNINELINIINEIREYDYCKIILVGNVDDILKVLKNLNNISILKEVCIEASNSTRESILSLLKIGDFKIKVALHAPYLCDWLFNEFPYDCKERLNLQFYVESEEEYYLLEKLQMREVYKYTLKPYFNGSNVDFLQKYVFLDECDIKGELHNKNQIFRKKTLNENFYGKLYVSPDGDVYANMNYASLGNIREKTLYELVYSEFKIRGAWFLTRDKCESCKKCEFRYLCPSISNMELVMNKFDLCMKNTNM